MEPGTQMPLELKLRCESNFGPEKPWDVTCVSLRIRGVHSTAPDISATFTGEPQTWGGPSTVRMWQLRCQRAAKAFHQGKQDAGRHFGPALPTGIRSSQLRSGSAHSDLELADGVRQPLELKDVSRTFVQKNLGICDVPDVSRRNSLSAFDSPDISATSTREPQTWGGLGQVWTWLQMPASAFDSPDISATSTREPQTWGGLGQVWTWLQMPASRGEAFLRGKQDAGRHFGHRKLDLTRSILN
eukprot:s2268_g3.t1